MCRVFVKLEQVLCSLVLLRFGLIKNPSVLDALTLVSGAAPCFKDTHNWNRRVLAAPLRTAVNSNVIVAPPPPTLLPAISSQRKYSEHFEWKCLIRLRIIHIFFSSVICFLLGLDVNRGLGARVISLETLFLPQTFHLRNFAKICYLQCTHSLHSDPIIISVVITLLLYCFPFPTPTPFPSLRRRTHTSPPHLHAAPAPSIKVVKTYSFSLFILE